MLSKIILIIGANSGFGFITAKTLAECTTFAFALPQKDSDWRFNENYFANYVQIPKTHSSLEYNSKTNKQLNKN